MDAKITNCEASISYEFQNKLTCLAALFTYPGVAMIQNAFRPMQPNSRLAIYGDAIVTAYLCKKWFDTKLNKGMRGRIVYINGPLLSIYPGEWTTVRNALISNPNLSDVGFTHGLERCVILNPGTFTVSGKTMATTVEAILGAVHIDGGDAALEHVMAHLGLHHELLNPVMYFEDVSCKQRARLLHSLDP